MYVQETSYRVFLNMFSSAAQYRLVENKSA